MRGSAKQKRLFIIHSCQVYRSRLTLTKGSPTKEQICLWRTDGCIQIGVIPVSSILLAERLLLVMLRLVGGFCETIFGSHYGSAKVQGFHYSFHLPPRDIFVDIKIAACMVLFLTGLWLKALSS